MPRIENIIFFVIPTASPSSNSNPGDVDMDDFDRYRPSEYFGSSGGTISGGQRLPEGIPDPRSEDWEDDPGHYPDR